MACCYFEVYLISFKPACTDDRRALIFVLAHAGSPHVCQLVAFGRNERMNYVIMSLVGLNLSELRKCQPRGRFSISTALRLGMQMLAALEELHSVGFIHRDVKPVGLGLK